MDDLVGVGFGPSNLALAVGLAEHPGASAAFLERQASFGWHRGMLIDDATMQVSFLKDLVTLRNPASEYSFLSYLHSKDRLLDFINHKNLYPLRVEFHDYLEWAAAKVAHLVHYGRTVVGVVPVISDGMVTAVEVHTQDGGVFPARNVVFGTGLRPHLPDGVVASVRVWHNHDLLPNAARLAAARRFVVVGAGQSAAEATAFLHRRFPAAEVCAVFSRYGYSPADDSSFVNRIFDPSAVEEFFGAPPEVKRLMRDYHNNTNYSVVDSDLIEDLYGRIYQEKVLGTPRLRMFNVSRLAHLTETESGVRVTVESLSTGVSTVLDADVVVYATGYRPADPSDLLGELGAYCRRDEVGRLLVERDYRVATAPGVHCGIYLQGGTEHTHGITSSLLSNTAIRAGEILQSILARRPPTVTTPRYALTALEA